MTSSSREAGVDLLLLFVVLLFHHIASYQYNYTINNYFVEKERDQKTLECCMLHALHPSGVTAAVQHQQQKSTHRLQRYAFLDG